MEVGDKAARGTAPPASSGGDLPAELHGQALLPAELDEVREELLERIGRPTSW
jgi:hypothetical protein